MPYLGKSMSLNAAIAHRKGLLPLSSITAKILLMNNFKYPKVFFQWLCKQGYIRPTEFHHASASKRLVRYYDPERIKKITIMYNLDNLYSLYRGKLTKEDILESRMVEYVKVVTEGKRLGANRNICFYCIKVDGLVLWSQNTAINMRHSKIIENYGPTRPPEWKNPNRKKILRKVVMLKKVEVKSTR